MRRRQTPRRGRKGFTLIELVCALAVATVAVAIGAQLFLVGTKAAANSSILDANTQAIMRFYESGQVDALDQCTAAGKTVTTTQTATTVRLTLGGGSVSRSVTMDTVTVEDGKTKTGLSCLQESIAGNAG